MIDRSTIRRRSITDRSDHSMGNEVTRIGIPRPPPPPLDARSARSAMNFVTSMFILLTIDTYSDNCQLSGNSSVVLSIAHFRPTCKVG